MRVVFERIFDVEQETLWFGWRRTTQFFTPHLVVADWSRRVWICC